MSTYACVEFGHITVIRLLKFLVFMYFPQWQINQPLYWDLTTFHHSSLFVIVPAKSSNYFCIHACHIRDTPVYAAISLLNECCFRTAQSKQREEKEPKWVKVRVMWPLIAVLSQYSISHESGSLASQEKNGWHEISRSCYVFGQPEVIPDPCQYLLFHW